MRTNVAARYARWAAVTAGIVALGVAGLYLRRSWEARQARRDMPAAVPPSVQQQSSVFSFSKVEGDHTLFTVRASRATEYTQDGHSVLEDVWVTLYGRSGQRFDNLRSHACDYISATGNIRCAGEVEFDFQSADDARLHPATAGHPNSEARILHVDTSGVTFDQKAGEAATDQRVTFRFPRGEGHGMGFRYESEPGQMELLRDVQVKFYQQTVATSAKPPADGDQDLEVSGSKLIYLRDERRMRLLGPVAAQQSTRSLNAQQLDLILDPEFRARLLDATGNPVLHDAALGNRRTITANEISAALSTSGWVESAKAEGKVQATSQGAKNVDKLDADRAELTFAEGSDHPERLIAAGNVRVQSLFPEGESRRVETSRIVVDFVDEGKDGAARIRHAATPAATVDFQGVSMASGRRVPERTHLVSQRLDADFGEGNQLRQATGSGGVEIRRQVGEQPVQVSLSREATARFDGDGAWSTVDQTGDVHLTQADRKASAERAHFDHGSDSVALAGSVVLSDGRTRTTAASALLRQGEHKFEAQGRVVSSDISAANSSISLGPGPARVSGDRVVADTASGRAVYSGGARLWQGDSLIEADNIELDQMNQIVTADGHVRSVLPKARWEAGDDARHGEAHDTRSTAKGQYIHAACRNMIYNSKEGHGRLEGDVQAESEDGIIRSEVMDMFFSPATPGSGASGAGQGQASNRQLVRATADGHVVVTQEDRQATADHAVYTAAEAKIALSGGPPTVRDGSGNVTTGRQLTFYFHDDTINIDSAEGMRTLTLHRVEK